MSYRPRALRSAFVVTIAASTVSAAACSASDDAPTPSTIDTAPEAESCGAALPNRPCSLEGQSCSDCPTQPYGLTCQGGIWTSVDLHGSCNPPGWPFDTGTPDTGTRDIDTGIDASAPDATLTDTDTSD